MNTLVLIKPDAVEQDVWFQIMMCYTELGLVIWKSKILTMSGSMARRFYQEHEGQPFFEELISHITSGPLVALEIRGYQAIEQVRIMNGATNPAEAELGTIRRLYGEPQLGPRNAVHGSDSLKSSARELAIIFGE